MDHSGLGAAYFRANPDVPISHEAGAACGYCAATNRVVAWKHVLEVVYGGIPGGREALATASDADQLRLIADWLDRIDDAADVAMDGRHVLDRSTSLQESLRRIAQRLSDG